MGDNPVMRGISWFAEHFIGLFNEAATQFAGLVTGILPLLMVMLTAMYAITTLDRRGACHARHPMGRTMGDHPLHDHAVPGHAAVDQPDGLYLRTLPARTL